MTDVEAIRCEAARQRLGVSVDSPELYSQHACGALHHAIYRITTTATYTYDLDATGRARALGLDERRRRAAGQRCPLLPSLLLQGVRPLTQ